MEKVVFLQKIKFEMVLKQIHLEHFRLFDKLTVDFDERLNIFLGTNGAGKSSLLDGIAILLSSFTARLADWRDAYGNMYFLKESDIRNNSDSTSIKLIVDYNNELLNWQLSTNRFAYGSKENRANSNTVKKISLSLIELLSNEPQLNIPILVYYNTNRVNEGKKKANVRVQFPQLLTYRNALNPSVESFNDFEEWFIEEEGYENTMRLEQDNKYRNPKIQIVRQVIQEFLSKLGTTRFTNLRVKKDRKSEISYKGSIRNALVINKGDIELELAQLSAGEKMILSTIIDIAHRLTLANPSLENPLKGEGVVLIDEIDLHLHPQWQREIVPALLDTFPNLQFILTTHSPQVLSKIEKKNILIIEDGQVRKNPPNTYGKDSNYILNTIFKTDERPSEIKEKIIECTRLLENEDFEKGKILLKELTAILGEDDPEIVEANTFLHFYTPETHEMD